jgi:pimeloyl-ACP methyl ester carboxylesterase
MRLIGLDIHRDFAEVAIAEGGEVRSAGRIEMTPETLELFAHSLGRDDQVALEVSGNAWEVARIIRPHVAKLVAVSPADTGIRAARAKTDRMRRRLRSAGFTRQPPRRAEAVEPTTTSPTRPAVLALRLICNESDRRRRCATQPVYGPRAEFQASSWHCRSESTGLSGALAGATAGPPVSAWRRE